MHVSYKVLLKEYEMVHTANVPILLQDFRIIPIKRKRALKISHTSM